MSKKPIVVFEGVEGSGKTLHINNLSNYLKKKKIKFLKIREPGGHFNSEKIRNLILNNKSKFHKTTDLLLYLAARNENLVNLLIRNYKKKVILIDRFTDSTLAYQHYGMGINIKFITTINNFLLKSIKTDLTFLNIVSKKNMKIRLQKRKKLNRYDKFKISFYNKVQKGYIKISSKNKKKYKIINSNNNISTNKRIIIDEFKKLIK
jgi:dTMP kinase